MPSAQNDLPDHKDCLFGVCQAVGDDFGFDPLWLRLAFIAPLIWSPALVFASYAALGAIVLVSRLLAPKPRAARPSAEAAPAPMTADNEAEPLAAAA